MYPEFMCFSFFVVNGMSIKPKYLDKETESLKVINKEDWILYHQNLSKMNIKITIQIHINLIVIKCNYDNEIDTQTSCASKTLMFNIVAVLFLFLKFDIYFNDWYTSNQFIPNCYQRFAFTCILFDIIKQWQAMKY